MIITQTWDEKRKTNPQDLNTKQVQFFQKRAVNFPFSQDFLFANIRAVRLTSYPFSKFPFHTWLHSAVLSQKPKQDPNTN
jgi:hypothetical protein